jgi:hypothetical protein
MASKGTTVDELKEIISRIQWKNPCLGVVLKDEVKNIPQENGFILALMINTTSTQLSSHWQMAWRKGNYKVGFSSFGDCIIPELMAWLGGNVLVTDFQIQQWNSTICGQLCILVAFLLDQGLQFEDIILNLLE